MAIKFLFIYIYERPSELCHITKIFFPELPLDYKFMRFSSKNSKTAGYYPNPPLILSNDETLKTK